MKWLTWKRALIGLGLGVVGYGLSRLVTAETRPFFAWQRGNTDSGEFERVARAMAAGHAQPIVRSVASVSELGQGLATAHEQRRLGPVVLVGHGTTRSFFPQFSPSLDPATAARLIAPHIGAAQIIGLAGCRAGASSDEPDWSEATYGPGGATSFAGQLRDALAALGVPGSVEVRAHTTTGGAGANPIARVFRVAARGQPGQSVIDIFHGRLGAWRDTALRRAWTAGFRGASAQKWIAGEPLPGALA